MRGHDDQLAASGLCSVDNRSGWVRIRNVQEFCRYPDPLRHSSNFVQDLARTCLAGCLKAIKHFLRGNPSRVPGAKVDRHGFRHGDDCHFSIQGLCQSNAMLNAFSRDIRSIRAQEKIGVHLRAPLLVEHFSQRSDAYLYGPMIFSERTPSGRRSSVSNGSRSARR